MATATTSNSGGGASSPNFSSLDEQRVHSLILELTSSTADREHALSELSKIRESFDDLALLLWHAFGVMTVLLQEVVSIYPLLNQPNLNANVSSRVCNALALMQCIASHQDTRLLFIEAQFPLYLYPILNTTTKTRPFEYLRLTSLGIIGALVKQDNPDVIAFLITTEIIPLCLRIMEEGNELCKTVAIFIVQKTLLDPTGLEYICQTYDRFLAVVRVLEVMTKQLVEASSPRILKHVLRCYLRLCDNKRARDELANGLPEALRDGTFYGLIDEDVSIKRLFATLLSLLDASPAGGSAANNV